MDRHVPSRTREIGGATLTISTVGGYSVMVGRDYLGYLHASQGDRFNTYLRVPGGPDKWLGKYVDEEAVRAIMRACGLAPAEVA